MTRNATLPAPVLAAPPVSTKGGETVEAVMETMYKKLFTCDVATLRVAPDSCKYDEDMYLLQVSPSRQVFDPLSIITGFQGFASPKFLDYGRTCNCDGDKKNNEIGNLTLGGGEKMFWRLKGQGINNVGNSGKEQPG